MEKNTIIDLDAFREGDSDPDVVHYLPSGTNLLRDQFTINGYLNCGGFGITYRATDSLGRRVAIKECFPADLCYRSGTHMAARAPAYEADLASVVEHFVDEAHRLANLKHKNIVHVHQIFEENDTAYMVMDFIDGPDLLDIADNADLPLSPRQIERITRRMLPAVAYVHRSGMLHRDISPDNILINSSGEPVLIDFGAAREHAKKSGAALSRLKFVKDGYSPQEFYIEGAEQGPWSDLYSLAASMHHLITGAPPMDGQNRLAAAAAKTPDPYKPLAGRYDGYTDGFLEALDKALEIIPQNRLQSAKEWLERLSALPQQSRPTRPLIELPDVIIGAHSEPKPVVRRMPKPSWGIRALAAGIFAFTILGGASSLALLSADASGDGSPTVDSALMPGVSLSSVFGSIQPNASVTPTLIGQGLDRSPLVLNSSALSVPTASATPQDIATEPDPVVTSQQTAALAAPAPAVLPGAVPDSGSAPNVATAPRLESPATGDLVAGANVTFLSVESALTSPATDAPWQPSLFSDPATPVGTAASLPLNGSRSSTFDPPATFERPAIAVTPPALATSFADTPSPVSPTGPEPVRIAQIGPLSISQPDALIAEVAVPPQPALPPLLSNQIAQSNWQVVMPFGEMAERIRNADTIAITEVSATADLNVSGSWIREGVIIYSFNGQALVPNTHLAAHFAEALTVDPDGYARATVRYRDPSSGTIDRGLLAVPVVRDITLADGTLLQARITDLVWSLEVVAPAVGSPLNESDMLLGEASTGTTFATHEDLSNALATLVELDSSTARFEVLRQGVPTTVDVLLARRE